MSVYWFGWLRSSDPISRSQLYCPAAVRCTLSNARYFRYQQEFEQAKNYYEKSLSEHRTPDTRAKLSEIEKIIKEKEELAYRDPEQAEIERTRGNDLFKQGTQ